MAGRPPARNEQRPQAAQPVQPPLYEYKPAPYRPQTRKTSAVAAWQEEREAVPLKENADPEEIARRKLQRTPGQAEDSPPPQRYPPQKAAPLPSYTPPPKIKRAPEPEPEYPRPRKSQWPVIKGIAIIVVVTVLLAALQLNGGMGAVREFLGRDVSQGLPTYRMYPESSDFSVNRVMASTCRGGELTYTVEIGIPKNYPGMQDVVDSSTNPSPTSSSSAYWNWTGTISNNQKFSVVISYHIKAYFKQWKITAEQSGTTANVAPNYASAYLKDCWKFVPSDNTVKDLAYSICGNTTNVFEKVQRVYTYINQNIAYLSNSPEEPKSPTKTLADRNGDCDDQSFLMGSLLRAQGVPAWLELGILYDPSQKHWGGHAWLQVLIPMKSGGAEIVNIDPANDQFLFRDASRMTDYVDDGNQANLQNYYISWRYMYTGGAPTREDRYDSIYFHPADKNIPMEKSGSSAGAQAAKDLWKIPGFDFGLVIIAGISASIGISFRRRHY